VTLGRHLFGNYFGYLHDFDYILLLLFTRFKVSADGQYTAVALNDSIHLSHSPELLDKAIANTLDVTNNATINTLSVNTINVNGSHIAKTKIVQYDYNVDISDYIICCDTSGCVARLPQGASIGQTLIFTNGKSLLPYSIIPPINGTLNGSSSQSYFGDVNIDAVTILCLGNNNWTIVSRYLNVI
jgi:hypothetical protein